MKKEEIEDDIYDLVESNKKKSIQGILDRLNRSLDEIQTIWPQATKLELYIAFNKSYNDPNQLVIDIEDKQFQEYIKDTSKELIAQLNSSKHRKSLNNSTIHSSIYSKSFKENDDTENEEEDDNNDHSKDDDSDFESEDFGARRWNLRRSSRSTRNSSSQQPDSEDEEENVQNIKENNSNSQPVNSCTENDDFNDESDDDDDFSYTTKVSLSSKKTKKSKKNKKSSSEKSSKKKAHKEQENIDLPRPKEISKADWETWSFAHKQSYLKGAKNANAYYYRNLRQGEKPRNGKWTPEETKLFLNRIKEMSKKNFYDSTPQWGIFSMEIPGRVGYQCANYYRNLVLEGKIYDPRYKIIDGKLKYIAFHQNENKRSKTKPKHKNVDDSDNYDNNDGDNQNLSIYERLARENPLIGAIDTLTKEEIRVPAISPDGYLLDYNTWLKIISTSGCDPYSTNHITKRSLVILNFDNIGEYRSKIKNLVMET